MTLDQYVSRGEVPRVDIASVPPRLVERKGCFVTLTKKGELRGCIGHIVPVRPLYIAVMENAVNAAVNDPRFPEVRKNELDQIEVEVSVLTIPQRLEFTSPEDLLAKLRPKVDGVVLRVGQKQSTYLPQVWEQLPEKVDFLKNLSKKAGLAEDAWRQKDVVIETYQDEAFKESQR